MAERRNKGDGWGGVYNFVKQMSPPSEARRDHESWEPTKVMVRFPDGDREVAAYVSVGDGFLTSRRRPSLSRLFPEPMDGWEFDEVYSNPSWIARRTRE